MTTSEIERAVLALPRAERLDLLDRLLKSAIPGDDDLSPTEWDELWGEEAARRLGEITRGEVQAIPGEVVHAAILRRLARRARRSRGR